MEDFQPWGFPSLLVHLFQEDPGVSLVHNLADCSVCRNEFVLTLNTIQSGLLCVQLANPDAVEGLVLVNIDTNARGWLDWAAQKVCLLIFAVSFMIVVFSIDDFFWSVLDAAQLSDLLPHRADSVSPLQSGATAFLHWFFHPVIQKMTRF